LHISSIYIDVNNCIPPTKITFLALPRINGKKIEKKQTNIKHKTCHPWEKLIGRKEDKLEPPFSPSVIPSDRAICIS